MRDDVYRKFSSQMMVILKDCMVPKELAQTSTDKYWHHEMYLPINKGKILYYDREKVKSHKDDLRKMIAELPQINLRWS